MGGPMYFKKNIFDFTLSTSTYEYILIKSLTYGCQNLVKLS